MGKSGERISGEGENVREGLWSKRKGKGRRKRSYINGGKMVWERGGRGGGKLKLRGEGSVQNRGERRYWKREGEKGWKS